MRDPEAAEAVGFTVHADGNKCVYGDSCQGQRDAVSNLTHAMSDLFHVQFHSVTAKAKSLEGFVLEVGVSPCFRAPVLSAFPTAAQSALQRFASLNDHLWLMRGLISV
jgi:hypothetical protein